MPQHTMRAFTLIELLVVVAITVVLLALITPALDKAVYQAELTVCAARQKGIGSSVTAYAMDSKRWYPARAPAPQASWRTWQLVMPFTSAQDPFDFRTTLRPALAINKMLNDPLTSTVDMETNVLTTWVYAPYSLWFGFAYSGQPGMYKVGDRWGWTVGTKSGNSLVLAGDLDETNYAAYVYGGHPDADGYTHQDLAQDDINFNTYSRWISSTGFNRGQVDLNFLYSDGAVTRFSGVPVLEDVRLMRITSFQTPKGWDQLMPPQ